MSEENFKKSSFSVNSTPPDNSELNVRLSMDAETVKRMDEDFQHTVADLEDVPQLQHFTSEYRKVHSVLKHSFENEQILMNKCRELHSEILSNAARISTATRLAQEDSSTMAQLKREIDKAWRMLDESHQKEERAGETINSLREEIKSLNSLIEKNVGFTTGQEQGIRDLLKAREQLIHEKDKLVLEQRRLGYEVEQQLEDIAAFKRKVASLERSQEKVEERNHELTLEYQKENKKRLKAEKEASDMKMDISYKTDAIKELEDMLNSERLKSSDEHAHSQHLKQGIENEIKERNILEHERDKFRKEADMKSNHITDLQEKLRHATQDMKDKDIEINNYKIARTKQGIAVDNANKKTKKLQQAKELLDSEILRMRDKLRAAEKEVDLLNNYSHDDKRKLDSFLRDQENLDKAMRRLTHKNVLLQRQIDLIMSKEKNHFMELTRLERERVKARRVITILERDRDRQKDFINSLKIQLAEMSQAENEKGQEINELKRSLGERLTELNNARTKGEDMRSERNVCFKKLMDTADEMDKAKKKVKTLETQLEQSKEDMVVKEHILQKEIHAKNHIEREKNKVSLEFANCKTMVKEVRAELDHQRIESDNLCRVIRQADSDLVSKSKLIDKLMSERDILGAQLISRNDELALLSEKLRILNTVVQRADIDYTRRLNDVRVLRTEVKRLKHHNHRLNRDSHDMELLRKELINLHRDLARERQRSKILEDELRMPKNGHRWRQLQGSDPSKFELLQKLHHYQKKLIYKTELVVKKSELLAEKEKLYLVLKDRMAKLPGTEVFLEVNRLSKLVGTKTKSLKCISADLNMFEQMYREERSVARNLERELVDFKDRYYRVKARLDGLRRKVVPMNEQLNGFPFQPRTVVDDLPKRKGGGFPVQNKGWQHHKSPDRGSKTLGFLATKQVGVSQH